MSSSAATIRWVNSPTTNHHVCSDIVRAGLLRSLQNDARPLKFRADWRLRDAEWRCTDAHGFEALEYDARARRVVACIREGVSLACTGAPDPARCPLLHFPRGARSARDGASIARS